MISDRYSAAKQALLNIIQSANFAAVEFGNLGIQDAHNDARAITAHTEKMIEKLEAMESPAPNQLTPDQ